MDTESVSSRITTTAEKEKKSLTINEQKIKKCIQNECTDKTKHFGVWGISRINIRSIGLSERQEENSSEEGTVKNIIAEHLLKLNYACTHNLDSRRVPDK